MRGKSDVKKDQELTQDETQLRSGQVYGRKMDLVGWGRTE